MLRRAVIDELSRTFSEMGKALPYPDHPLVADGPDLLLAHDQQLTALFVYSQHSRTPSTVTEQARIWLARLAYPSSVRFCALYADRELDPQSATTLFDAVSDGRDLAALIQSNETNTRLTAVLKALHGPHYSRFAASQHFSSEQGTEIRKDHQTTERPTYLMFDTETVSRRRHLDMGPEGIVGSIDPRLGRSIAMNRTQSFAEAATLVDYGVGHGISALEDVAGRLHTPEWRLAFHRIQMSRSAPPYRAGSDILKPQRVAAFAGGKVVGQ